VEQKFRLLIGKKQKFDFSVCRKRRRGVVMTTLQAVCFGAMLAWTPSLVVLALLLHAFPLDEFQREPF
jgi:hypothetical protein